MNYKIDFTDLNGTCIRYVPTKTSQIPVRLRRLPFYTLCMFIIYISIYFSICTDQNDSRISGLELNTSKGKEVYRWYTYSLLHAGKEHIGINMLCLLIYGSLVEFDNNSWRLLVIHVLSIFGGAFGAGWESRFKNETSYVIGASGGNYGLLSSQIGNLVLNWYEINLYKRIIYTILISSSVICDITVNIVLYNPDIAYSNHFGGFVFGLFAGLVFMKNQKQLQWEKMMQYGSASLFGVLSLASAINLGMLR